MKKLALSAALALSMSAQALPLRNPSEILQVPIQGEWIVKMKANKKLSSKLNSEHMRDDIYFIKGDNISMIESDIEWKQPNYEYIGNALEVVNSEPNDPRFAEQFHHSLIKTTQAWEIETGSAEVVVAVTDNGFDLEHDDLKDSYWKNEDEIEGNGIDDDNNGYIDDYHAWNFSAGNNNPRPNDNSHGTHVAGIITAAAHNNVGVAGVAPGVKVMPIKFYGEGSWTSKVVADSYKYAVKNGAKIISTSFNIDGFVNDNLYIDTTKYIRANGVLLFNSAGNGNKRNPPRQKFEEVILVCSTQSNKKKPQRADVRSRFSNYGTGIDVCAPGDPILSTVNGKYQGESRYGEMSGTSMAAPTAAAVAALIWSKYPEFSAEEVLEKLYATSDDLTQRNPSRARELGSGRVNAYRAVTE